jgi:hypothetical protein
VLGLHARRHAERREAREVVGITSCTCSIRGGSASASELGVARPIASSAWRTPASPMAWIVTENPAAAASPMRSASSAASSSDHAAAGRVVVGSSSAAVREPSVPSAKSLSEPGPEPDVALAAARPARAAVDLLGAHVLEHAQPMAAGERARPCPSGSLRWKSCNR